MERWKEFEERVRDLVTETVLRGVGEETGGCRDPVELQAGLSHR